MPWAKLSDDWYDHPKVVELGDDSDAIALWALGLSRTGKRRKGGFLSNADLAGLRPKWRAPRLRKAVEHLVAVGLLDRASGGFVYHDHEEYNPQLTDEVIHARAEGAAEGGRRRAQTADRRPGGTFAPKRVAPVPIPGRFSDNPGGIPADGRETGGGPELAGPASSQPQGWSPDPSRPDPTRESSGSVKRESPSAHEAAADDSIPSPKNRAEATNRLVGFILARWKWKRVTPTQRDILFDAVEYDGYDEVAGWVAELDRTADPIAVVKDRSHERRNARNAQAAAREQAHNATKAMEHATAPASLAAILGRAREHEVKERP